MLLFYSHKSLQVHCQRLAAGPEHNNIVAVSWGRAGAIHQDSPELITNNQTNIPPPWTQTLPRGTVLPMIDITIIQTLFTS